MFIFKGIGSIYVDGDMIARHDLADLFKEDVSQYSLETPELVKIINELSSKEYKFDYSNIKNIPTLIEALKGAKK